MGISIDTNLKFVDYNPGVDTDNSFVKIIESNPITIFDSYTNSGIDPQAVFEDFFADTKTTPPTYITVRGDMGGGGISPDLVNQLLNDHTSSLYLPTIVINAILVKLVVDLPMGLLKEIFKRLRKHYKRKRVRVFYFTSEEQGFFEFSSETNVEEFEKGVKEIPRAMKDSFRGRYFIRSLKEEKWIEEDIE